MEFGRKTLIGKRKAPDQLALKSGEIQQKKEENATRTSGGIYLKLKERSPHACTEIGGRSSNDCGKTEEI